MVKKEFIQTLRDPQMRWLLFGPPLIQMLVFGYAATLDVRNVTLSVLDLDNTQESRELVAHFSASRYFHLNGYACRPADLREGLDRGDILAAMEIDSGFAQRLRNGQGADRAGAGGLFQLQHRPGGAGLYQPDWRQVQPRLPN